MRWMPAVLSTLLATALALYPLTLVEAEAQLLVPAAAAPLLFTAAVVFGIWRCAAGGAFLLLAEYALALIVRDSGADPSAVIYGVTLLFELELVDLAVLAARKATVPKEIFISRGRFAAGSGLAGALAGAAAFVAGTAATGGHPVVLLVGAAAGAGAVWLAVALARRTILGL
jgi:hypothetical protein